MASEDALERLTESLLIIRSLQHRARARGDHRRAARLEGMAARYQEAIMRRAVDHPVDRERLPA
jgi:hypothetical protein